MSLKTWWAKRKENKPRMDSEVFKEKNDLIQNQVCEIDTLKAQVIELKGQKDQLLKQKELAQEVVNPDADVYIDLKLFNFIVSIDYFNYSTGYETKISFCKETVGELKTKSYRLTVQEHNELIRIYTNSRNKNKIFKTNRTKKEVTNDPSQS